MRNEIGDIRTFNQEQTDFLVALIAERDKQCAIWGGAEHDKLHQSYVWGNIMRERVFAIEQLPIPPVSSGPEYVARYRRLLIEIAAVACAAYEVAPLP